MSIVNQAFPVIIPLPPAPKRQIWIIFLPPAPKCQIWIISLPPAPKFQLWLKFPWYFGHNRFFCAESIHNRNSGAESIHSWQAGAIFLLQRNTFPCMRHERSLVRQVFPWNETGEMSRSVRLYLYETPKVSHPIALFQIGQLFMSHFAPFYLKKT